MVKTALSPRLIYAARVKGIARAMRPRQWTKNGAVFVGIVFSQRLFSLVAIERALLAFVIFCLASSSVYLLNDLFDMQYDRQHPTKKLRPFASGLVPVHWGLIAIMLLLLLCAGLLLILFQPSLRPSHDVFAKVGGANILFTLTIIVYITLMACYSGYLKHVALLDVFIIASGFVLRIFAGAIVIAVSISPWLYLVTCFLSLFLAFSKRRYELILLQEQAEHHRLTLKEYNVALLDQIITIVVTGTIIAYSIYTIEGPTKNHLLVLTIPFVLYGILRYLYLMHMHKGGGSPEEVLLRDTHVRASVVLCVLFVITLLYFVPV